MSVYHHFGCITIFLVLLCRHVANTSDIGSFVISNFHGTGQGTKKVTAVTGELAQQVLKLEREAIYSD